MTPPNRDNIFLLLFEEIQSWQKLGQAMSPQDAKKNMYALADRLNNYYHLHYTSPVIKPQAGILPGLPGGDGL